MDDQNDHFLYPIDSQSKSDGRETRPRRNGRRLRPIIGTGVTALVLASVCGWLAVKASTVSDNLEAANRIVGQLRVAVLRHDDQNDAAELVRELKVHTLQARQAAEDPLWTVAKAVPLLGQNFEAVSTVATSADDVAVLAADPLVGVIDSLDWARLRPNGEGINLAPLTAAQSKLESASEAVRQSSERLNTLNDEALLPALRAPLLQARDQLTSLRGQLDVAADVSRLAPRLLGSNQSRNYLLLVQNNAEARATGGIPGALAVLEVSKGKVTLKEQTSATEFGPTTPNVSVEPEQQQIYSARLGKFMQDVNLTPDFPTSAATAKEMWEQKTGDHLDGVLAIDPIALSYMLKGIGPLHLQDPQFQDLFAHRLPTQLTSGNVVKTLLSDVYSKIPDPALQDLYFAGVAKELFSSISAGKGDTSKLLDAAVQAASEGRLLLWSVNRDEQEVIADYPVGGAIAGPNISPAQFGVYFNDGTGAKMDYYVERTVRLIRGCPVDGYSEVKVRVTSTNRAPRDAAKSLPDYVTGAGIYGVPGGSVQTNIVAYGPVQSRVETVSYNGSKVAFASQRHSDRPVGVATVRIGPGQSATVEFTFGKIVQHTEPRVTVTPTVQPVKDVLLQPLEAACSGASQ